ncbi:RidA family protein [Asticcacaulis tiandongensis]|uniref:RidA family protein n=1 Tax=Asticcacaulis tiandongensis TaxID=2565365 RepID=UPI00112721C0|nr:RidA family protein [Asticcacaulis tiandongensis]
MARQLITSGSPFEPKIGFSRAVRIGNRIEVSGTTPVREGKVVGSDTYEQTKVVLETIVAAVEQAGGKVTDIIRTRIFLTDISQWEGAARAHGEVFGEIRPASSFIGTSGLINPEWLVEIEASAQIED